MLDLFVLHRFRVELLLHLALIAVAFSLRVLWLGERPFHHDESIHAYYGWRIVMNGIADYRYDPTYHGPTLYYFGAALQWLLGPSDFSARLLPVLSGVGLTALAWPLRHVIGKPQALVYATLVTFSPTLVYYSRSLRHDMPHAFFSLAALVLFLRYLSERRPGVLYASALLGGLAVATKEDFFLTAFALANGLWIIGLWSDDPREGVRSRALRWLREIRTFALGSRRPVIFAGLIFGIVYLAFYTSLLTHPENWNAVEQALRYWWAQHEIARIGGPVWYYVPLSIAYEPLIFIAAALGILRWSRHGWPSRGAALLAAWAVVTLALYSWAQEKVPWLLVPMLVPQALVAAHFFVESPRRFLPLWLPAVVVGGWGLISSSYFYDAPRPAEAPDRSHSEPLVFVHTTYEVPAVVSEIEAVIATIKTDQRTPIIVIGNATWPLAWYLRGHDVRYGSLPRETNAPVLVVDPELGAILEAQLGTAYVQRRFSLRGWWQIDWGHATLGNVARFLLDRRSWNPPGTLDAVLFVARDRSADGSLVRLEPVRAPARVTSPAIASRDSSDAEAFGRPGSGPGELREPRGLVIESDGTVLVADSGNNRIQRFRPSGHVLAVWGGPAPGNGPGEFRGPSSVAVAPDGSIYVADTWNHRVQKLSTEGDFLAQWTEEAPGLWGPRDLAVAVDGSVYVADTGNKRILVYDPNGVRRLVFGGPGSANGQLLEPVGLTIDPKEEILYVADAGNRRIQLFRLDGTFLQAWPVEGWEDWYSEPYLAWSGALWATDSVNRRVRVYGASGELSRQLGDVDDAGIFERPTGIAISPAGEVFVSDRSEDRIVVFSAAPAKR